MTTYRTLKTIGFTTLFAALVTSGAAFADQRPGLINGTLVAENGITLPATPADLRGRATSIQSSRSSTGSVERLYGVYFRDSRGIVLPLSGEPAPAASTSTEAPIALSTGNEVLYGNFMKVNGVVLPATPGQLRDSRTITATDVLAGATGR